MSSMKMVQVNHVLMSVLLTCSTVSPGVAQESRSQVNTRNTTPPSVMLSAVPSEREKILGDGYKFFYFHKRGVSFEQAGLDLTQCRAHLATADLIALPNFIPFGEHNSTPVKAPMLSPYGLVGNALSAIIAPKAERGLDNNKLRRCMGTRGYVRYALSEETWKAINTGEETQIIQMQAILASGPQPHQPEVVR